ncbi:alanine/glycine:cation symporter family protein [Shewanella surugensis]|uniref:Alanine:cation symporter family protein n=1 Tax=Shewanella surugensis TaxID=212020 RepID=A0ABT0L5V0_9GAMM|nr:alanine/glycine:cation symporter family protein [Shewanella surugensis]MCL1123063.1 alanine:cation symporter family protein [Shewanella surugensis]
MFEMIVDFLNALLWGKILVYGLVGAGLFFTLRLGFIQITHFKHSIITLLNSRKGVTAGGLSSFQVFCTSMAARVGAGNMAGVAVAISVGGPGAIFWMWLIAVLGMATAMVESTLAQIYKVRDENGQFRGGPAYYMEKGLGQRWMGILFSIFLIIAFGLVFNAVQANTITAAMTQVFGFSAADVGLILVIFSGFVIMGGLRKVARVSELLVPFMALAYITVALVVVVLNFEKVPAALMLVVKSAFGLQEVVAGGVAYSVTQAMQSGIARGLFSNEAGMGSAANIAGSASPYPNHPASQGFVQMMGVFVDTMVICTATAAIILLTGDIDSDGDGIRMTIDALTGHVGQEGGAFIAFTILFFCFTSIIANYSYAETNVLFLTGHKEHILPVFRLIVLGMVMFGSLAKVELVWALADVSMGLMATVNIIALLLLSGLTVRVIQDYCHQLKSGKLPSFDYKKFPELMRLKDNAWSNEKTECEREITRDPDPLKRKSVSIQKKDEGIY